MAVTPETVLAQWSTLVEGLQWSPKDFYGSVEQALQRRQLPDIFCFARELRRRRSIFGQTRVPSRDAQGPHFRHLWCAVWHRIFFSSWLGGRPGGCLGLLLLIPVLNILVAPFSRETYYKYDSAMMFQESVHSAVLEVIDGLTSAKGIRALSELERKPVMRKFLGR